MQNECSADRFGFAPVEGRKVVSGFDGGMITSDAGAVLLGETDRAIGLVERLAGCFVDARVPALIEHAAKTLVGQSVIGIALDATDNPLHGAQEGRFFHGYYGNYCYLPLYVTCAWPARSPPACQSRPRQPAA